MVSRDADSNIKLSDEAVEAIAEVEALDVIDGAPAAMEEKSALLDEFSDRLAAFRTLTHGDDQAATDQILGEFGANGKVDARHRPRDFGPTSTVDARPLRRSTSINDALPGSA